MDCVNAFISEKNNNDSIIRVKDVLPIDDSKLHIDINPIHLLLL